MYNKNKGRPRIKNQKMKTISKISYLLTQRLQFLEQLFLISSYHELMTSNTKTLIEKHSKMQKQQTDTVTNVLRAVRIDDLFKKQFHAIVLKAFAKVDAGAMTRQEATGAYKDIISDYLVFFGDLKEKYIVDFIKQIFELHIYNQTTVIYVLVQLLFKFLRIKCMSFITDRIEPKLTARKALDRFSYLMLNENQSKDSNKRVKTASRQKISSSSLSQNKRKASFESKSQINESFHIKSKTMVYQTVKTSKKRQMSRNLFSASGSQKRQTIHHSLDWNPSKPKRRIIKSYKDIQQQTKQKIQSQSLNMKQYSYSKTRPYANMFVKVYREEWDQYQELIGNWESLEEDEPESPTKTESLLHSSQKRKNEWYFKNCDKVVVEACTRNDQIRKQMQAYSQQYFNKFKK